MSSGIPVRITNRHRTSAISSGSNDSKQARVVRPIPRVERHILAPERHLTFDLFNVRSLLKNVEYVLEIRRDHSVDVILLTESWHDTDN